MSLSTDGTDRLGIAEVSAKFIKMGWTFREQAVSDFGVDAQIEKTGEDRLGTGRLIALQIKSGKSYFKKSGADWVYYGKQRHREYWTNHSLPVFLILHNPETDLTIWQRLDPDLVRDGANGAWSILIPTRNVLNAESESFFLAGIATGPASVRRHRLSLDMPLIRRVATEDEVYFVLEEWVNKSLNFRGIEIYFGVPEGQPADIELDWMYPARGPAELVAELFPWAKYVSHEVDDDYGGGEVEQHTMLVELSDVGRAALTLDDFYENGVEPQDEGAIPGSWLESIDDLSAGVDEDVFEGRPGNPAQEARRKLGDQDNAGDDVAENGHD